MPKKIDPAKISPSPGLILGTANIFVVGSAGSGVRNIDLVFSDEHDTASTTPSRTGVRELDLSEYPTALGSLSRQIRFRATMENSEHSTQFYTEVRLVDLTNNIEVTGTLMDNSSEVDRSIVKEFDSGSLSIGSSAGDIRDDAPTLYSVEFRGVGTLGPTERAILSNARLEIRYV